MTIAKLSPGTLSPSKNPLALTSPSPSPCTKQIASSKAPPSYWNSMLASSIHYPSSKITSLLVISFSIHFLSFGSSLMDMLHPDLGSSLNSKSCSQKMTFPVILCDLGGQQLLLSLVSHSTESNSSADGPPWPFCF